MQFKEHLSYFRSRAHLSKTSLAEKLSLTPTTIMEWESGRKKPPPIERCEQIARILNLSSEEKERLVDTAMIERMNPEQLQWYTEQEKKFKAKTFTASDIIECVNDETSLRAFLSAHKNNQKFLKIMKDIIRNNK